MKNVLMINAHQSFEGISMVQAKKHYRRRQRGDGEARHRSQRDEH